MEWNQKLNYSQSIPLPVTPGKLISTADENVVKHISELLLNADVPSFLWGDYVLTIYGVPSIIGGIDFVVPDERLPVAVAVLKNSSLQPCPAPKSCTVPRETRQSPVPVFHMHIEELDVNVSLRAHSETLWFSPPPALVDTGLAWKSPYYISASDPSLPRPRPGRGHGAFSSDGPTVLIPRAHVLLEAYIRLASAFRDDFANLFLSMVNYMEEYLECDGWIDDELLSDPCRAFWKETKKGRRPVKELVDKLQLALGDAADRDSGGSSDAE